MPEWQRWDGNEQVRREDAADPRHLPSGVAAKKRSVIRGNSVKPTKNQKPCPATSNIRSAQVGFAPVVLHFANLPRAPLHRAAFAGAAGAAGAHFTNLPGFGSLRGAANAGGDAVRCCSTPSNRSRASVLYVGN